MKINTVYLHFDLIKNVGVGSLIAKKAVTSNHCLNVFQISPEMSAHYKRLCCCVFRMEAGGILI